MSAHSFIPSTPFFEETHFEDVSLLRVPHELSRIIDDVHFPADVELRADDRELVLRVNGRDFGTKQETLRHHTELYSEAWKVASIRTMLTVNDVKPVDEDLKQKERRKTFDNWGKLFNRLGLDKTADASKKSPSSRQKEKTASPSRNSRSPLQESSPVVEKNPIAVTTTAGSPPKCVFELENEDIVIDSCFRPSERGVTNVGRKPFAASADQRGGFTGAELDSAWATLTQLMCGQPFSFCAPEESVTDEVYRDILEKHSGQIWKSSGTSGKKLNLKGGRNHRGGVGKKRK